MLNLRDLDQETYYYSSDFTDNEERFAMRETIEEKIERENRKVDRLIDLEERSDSVDKGPPQGSITRFLRDRELGVRGTCERFTRQINVLHYRHELPDYLRIRKIRSVQIATRELINEARSNPNCIFNRFVRDGDYGKNFLCTNIRYSLAGAPTENEPHTWLYTHYEHLSMSERAFLRRRFKLCTRSNSNASPLSIDDTYEWVNYYLRYLPNEKSTLHLYFPLGNSGLRGDIFLRYSGTWTFYKSREKNSSYEEYENSLEKHIECYRGLIECEGCRNNLASIVCVRRKCDHHKLACKKCFFVRPRNQNCLVPK